MTADYVAVVVACAQQRLNRAEAALEAAKVAFTIAKRERQEARDALREVKAGRVLGSNLLVPGECRHETVFLKNPPDVWACRDCGELIDGSTEGAER